MSNGAQNEKRTLKRVETRLPVSLEWKNGKGMIRRTRGVTRDVSRKGLFCYLEDPVPNRQPIELDLVFPTEMTASTPLALHCRAVTVRSETGERRFGVAARIEDRRQIDLGSDGLEPERRVQSRVKPRCVVAVEYPGLAAQIRDISPTGAFIADERPLPLGRRLELHFRLDNSGPVIEVHAVVRRVDAQIGMAVEFIQLTEEAAARLVEYASHNGSAP